MAKELLKFGLEELIVLWDNPQQVWHTIATVVASPEIRRKLAIMGTEYKKTQSGPSFAYNLERILDTIRLNSFI